MKLTDIHSLEKFNQILDDTAQFGYDNAITVSSGARDFKLMCNEERESIDVKMRDIIERFDWLARRATDKHLVGEIHDKIFKLNLEGENKLKAFGTGAYILRNLKMLFFTSTFKSNDKVEETYLFSTPAVKSKAEQILREFKNLPHTPTKEYQEKFYVLSLINHIYQDSKFYYDKEVDHINKKARDEWLKGEEDTKNAIRYIAYYHPEIALKMTSTIKKVASKKIQFPPKEFHKQLNSFATTLEDEINNR
jgi:hypothetical protein